MWLGCLIPELCCWFSHSSGFIWNSAFLMPAGTACVGLFWFSINCCIFPLHSRRTGGIPAGSGVAGPQQGFYVPITVIGPCWRHLGGKTNPYALGSYSGKKEGGYSPSKHTEGQSFNSLPTFLCSLGEISAAPCAFQERNSIYTPW